MLMSNNSECRLHYRRWLEQSLRDLREFLLFTQGCGDPYTHLQFCLGMISGCGFDLKARKEGSSLCERIKCVSDFPIICGIESFIEA
jgi:hypothetical protein